MRRGRECIIAVLLRRLGLEANNDFETRLAIQKITYLAQEIGIPLGYKFKWYTYGPYSRKLALDTGKILHTRVEDCPAHLRHYLEPVDDLLRELEERSRESGKNLLYWLELVASLHMLRYNTYPRVDDVVEELLKYKRRFSVDDARSALDIVEKYFQA